MATSSAEVALIDTNVFVFARNTAAVHHAACADLVRRATTGAFEACVTPSVLFEYVAVVTVTKVLPRALSIEAATREAEELGHALRVLLPPHDHWERTLALARNANIIGRAIFDASIVTTMLAHGVTRIYTYNVDDFVGIPGITILTP